MPPPITGNGIAGRRRRAVAGRLSLHLLSALGGSNGSRWRRQGVPVPGARVPGSAGAGCSVMP